MRVWYFNGVNLVRVGTPSLGRIPEVSWKLAGTADFTGDGRPDALWHNHATGELRIWQLIDITLVGVLTPNPKFVGPTWRIAALGDADLDGKADIVWQDAASGGLVLWTMNGVNLTGGGYLEHSRRRAELEDYGAEIALSHGAAGDCITPKMILF